MADYEAVLRQVETARDEAKKDAIKQKEKYIMTYENDDAEMNNDDEEDVDDLDLDDAEVEAYLRLKEANKRINLLEQREENPNKYANLLLRSTQKIYNEEGLSQKHDEIQVSKTAPWIDYLQVVSPQPLQLDDHDDQVERELKFYEQALISVQEGLQKLNSAGVKTERPDDFFAEMVKSDSHMLKVKSQLLENQKEIEKREDNRKRREMKKIGKQLRAQKLREKIEEKKANIKLVEYWRKQHGGKGKEFDLQQFEESVKKMQAERMQKYHETQQPSTKKGVAGSAKGAKGAKGAQGAAKGGKSGGAAGKGKFGGPKGVQKKGGAQGGKKRVGKKQRQQRTSRK